jgi:hypothetical protein
VDAARAKAFAAFAANKKDADTGMEQTATLNDREILGTNAPNPKFVRTGADTASLRDLIAVLTPAPKGLRKWSVMRAIRARRESAGRDIPLKFEADIERAFRRFCAGDPIQGAAPAGAALFYRPKETAGEVWAVDAEKARSWLDAEPFGED